MNPHIDSETGRLKSVLLHTPGAEVENMSPKSAERDLYNDIVPLSVVSGEHKRLKDFLSLVADTHEILELFIEALGNPLARADFIRGLTAREHAETRRAELEELSAPELAAVSVQGLLQRRGSLSDFLSDRDYDLSPVPNLYFVRDTAAVVREGLVVGAMANSVRRTEALILKTIFLGHPEFAGRKILFDGIAEGRESTVTLEGGDILVAKKNLLLFGISERTTAEAVDRLLSRL
jgi:arginine deiminase